MTKKEVKRVIKQTIESHIPNQAPKMNWALISETREKEAQVVTKKPFLFHVRLGLSFALTLFFAFGIWWLIDGFGTGEPIRPSGIEIFQKEENTLPLSFLSTASLLPVQNEISSQTIMLLSDTTSPIDPIRPFLGMIETIISQAGGPLVEVKASDKAEYETWIVIHTLDLLGMPVTYEMYYNIISYEEDGEEFTFSLEGIMIGNQMTYPMIGSKEVEENEEKIIIRGIIDERSYIESVYEFEDDEEKYVIRQVQNNQLIYESIVKVEEEQDEIKVKMEVESQFEKSSYEMKYELDTDRPMIKVEYETENYETEIKISGEMKIYVVIDEITQLTSYQIVVKTEDDEYTEDYERNLKHDEDDEDDEDEDDEEDDENEDDEDDEQDEDDVK